MAFAELAMASFFPATPVWLGLTHAVTKAANSAVLCAAIAGNALFPPLVGRAIAGYGPDAAEPEI